MSNVSAKARLSAAITVPDSTGMNRTFTISEGDIVKGLTYEANGVTRTVDGVVHLINYAISNRSINTTNVCYCKRGSQFASQVSITAIVVDSSNQYAADVNAIPINGIISIDSVNISSLGVANVTLEGFDRLTFTSDGEVDSVLWNNEIAELTEEGNKFVVTLPSMQKVNELRIFSEDRFFTTTVNGIEPDVDRDECINNALTAIMARMQSGNYEPEDLYVIVASDVGYVDTVTIDDIDFSESDIIPIMNLSTSKEDEIAVFEVDNGLLKIAAPVLMEHVDDVGRTHISVAGYDFDVPGFADAEARIGVSASAGGGKGGLYKNLVTVMQTAPNHIDLAHERQDGSAFVALTARTEDGPIPDSAMAIMVDNSVEGYVIGTFGMLKNITNSDSTSAFTHEEDLHNGKSEYKFFIPDYGKFDVFIDTVESICVFNAVTADDLTSMLANPDAMVIELGADVALDAGMTITRPGVVIDGGGNTLTASSVENGKGGILVSDHDVTIRNITIDATGDYAIKLVSNESALIENVTAISHTKGAIQINGANAVIKGDIVTEGPWGGIEVCKGARGTVPSLVVLADSVTCNTSSVPTIWVDKALEDGLQNTVTDAKGILTQMSLPANKADADQIWYK